MNDAPPASVWLVTYKGQTEDPYEWMSFSLWDAHMYKTELEQKFPNREWTVEEKDVS